MRVLRIPAPLKQEFATVEALWTSSAATRRVDALLLCWVKYEKQLRRLFSFLVFQHPAVTENTVENVVAAMVADRSLYPEKFVRGINALGVCDIHTLLAEEHSQLPRDIERIKSYRNKLMHGQITGQNISSNQIEKDIIHLVRWVSALAEGAEREFGYDGLKRNTFKSAKASVAIVVSEFPFTSSQEFTVWLKAL